MDFNTTFNNTRDFFRDLFHNPYFWGGLGGLFICLFIVYFLFNSIIMPGYTRHDTSISVPDVKEMEYEEAAELLKERNLEVERTAQQYNPDLPLDVVADQSPEAETPVKPGRRIYLTINSGHTPMVNVPSLEGTSVREARNRLEALGLELEELQSDTIPSPYRNTITRQEPAPGDSLERGSGVTLWYSTGLGEERVSVPDVTNMTVEEAREQLLENRLRSVIVVMEDDADDETASIREEDDLLHKNVVRQSREPGTRVQEGFEIRLFVERQEDDS